MSLVVTVSRNCMTNHMFPHFNESFHKKKSTSENYEENCCRYDFSTSPLADFMRISQKHRSKISIRFRTYGKILCVIQNQT